MSFVALGGGNGCFGESILLKNTNTVGSVSAVYPSESFVKRSAAASRVSSFLQKQKRTIVTD